jgi:hypothetical protein
LFTKSINIIPTHSESEVLKLLPKASLIPSHFLLFLSVSIILVAMARLTGKRLIATHGEALFSTSHLNNFTRDGLKLNDFFSFVLIINSVFCTSYLFFLFLASNKILFGTPFLVMLTLFGVISLLFFWQLLVNWILILLTGERQIFIDNFNNVLLSYPLRGLLLLPILFIIILHPTSYFICFIIAAVFLFLFQLIRVIRCLMYAFSNKVKWYYIILYFCTLEILPLVVIYYNFVGKV